AKHKALELEIERLLKAIVSQLFKKVSDQKDNTQDMSKNTKFAKQPIVENLPKIGIDNTKTKRPQLGAIQRMIGSPMRLRVVEARIKKLK
nr:hypothetical protein [Tanacetum cinerariifolium]